MNRHRRMMIESAILSRIATEAIASLKDNLERSEGDGQPLAPLMAWDRLNFTGERGTGQRWVKADRTNADKPLVDTGRLLNSIHVSQIVGASMLSDGGKGRSYQITISAAEYGNDFTETKTFSNVIFGRTKAIRSSRNFGDMREGKDFVVKKQLTVPGRPWNRIPYSRLVDIAEGAVKGIGG